MRPVSKYWIFGLAIVAGIALAALTLRQATAPTTAPTASGSPVVPETGVVHDLTERNHQVVVVRPGDLVEAPLIGEVASGLQWSFRSPMNGGYLSLKKHLVTERDVRLQANQSLSDWIFKIEKAGTFTLRFDYENVAQRARTPVKIFSVKIISDRTVEQLPDLLVDEPQPSSVLANGTLRIAGYIRPQAGAVTYTLSDDAGQTVVSGTIPIESKEPDAFVAFEKIITFRAPNGPDGMLSVTAENLTLPQFIPVVYNPQLVAVQVFFGRRDAAAGECGKTSAVKRYVRKDDNVPQVALRQLLAGPTAGERQAGAVTNIPASVAIQSLTIADGVATADFSAELTKKITDRCRLAGMRAQIEQTLKQFPEIKNVVIFVAGKTAAVLQP